MYTYGKQATASYMCITFSVSFLLFFYKQHISLFVANIFYHPQDIQELARH